tara:strand:+ start:483 stop:2303 length:1821 start_codon:yes stop_codon:yes gene_type:complete
MATAATAKYVIRLEDKTKRAFKAIGRSLKSVTKSIFSMKTGLISAAGIAGLGFLIKKSMNATDEMAKMSRAIGVSVEELSALRHAASLGGLASTQLDKAVQKLAINMADMSRGVGLAKDVFEKHNISVTNVDGSLRTVMEVMDDVADVTAGMTNQTEKADLAYKLFGARGAKMINMLNGGSDAMREAMKEAELLGLVMSSETAKGVEDANDSFTRLQAFMTSTFAQTVAALAPAIRSMTDALIDFVTIKVKETDGGIAAIATSMANTIIDATVSILQALETTANGVIEFATKIKVALGFGTEVEELEQQLIHLRGVQEDFFTQGFGNKDDGIFDFFENLGTAYKKAIGVGLDTIGLEGSETVERLMLEKINTVKAQLRTLKNAGETTIELDFSGITSSLIAAKTPIAMFEDSLNTIIERGNEANTVTTTLAEPTKWKFAGDAFKAYSDTIKTETAQVAMVTTRLLGGAEDAIMAMIAGAKFSWKGLVKSILMDLARIQVKKAILGVATALFSFDGGGYTGSGGRSGGVDGKGGFPAILHPNETVIDHTKGGGLGGSTTAEINFNVQAIDASSFNNYLVNNRDTIESIINNSLLTNGTVRRTIQMTS